VVDNFQQLHTTDEMVLVGYDFADSFNSARTGYYGISAWPTVCGDGLSDIWPCSLSTLASDLGAHSAKTSPLKITLIENGEGDFTASITAEADVSNASLMMVAVLDEYVPANGGGQSHLPYHAKVMLTSATGDAFSILSGETIDINKTFTVDPTWDYEKMGVACWVQGVGGTNPSPQADIPSKHEVYQAAFLAAGETGVDDGLFASTLALRAPNPNPFRGAAAISLVLGTPAEVDVVVYDVTGRVVRSISSGALGAGEHTLRWDGRDVSGGECAAGVYFARATGSDGQTATAKLVRLR